MYFSILASGAYPRPNLMPGRDPTLGLHHPSDVLARPFADQVRPYNFVNTGHFK